jgi:Putative auto-transporter adhesin, head GIN domain
MNKRQFVIANCFAAILALVSKSAHANPDVVGKTYAPGSFDKLTFSGSAAVQFRQGDKDEIFVEGDEEMQNSITLELRGGRLEMRSEGSWKFWRGKGRPKVHVQMRDLKELQISGAADFVADEAVNLKGLRVDISGAGVARFERLKADALRFSVSGSGDGYFTGSASELSVNISGRSDFYGENLLTRNARVSISGLGKAQVWNVGDLSASVSGIGTIDYWGNPKLDKRSSGISTFNDRGAKPAP